MREITIWGIALVSAAVVAICAINTIGGFIGIVFAGTNAYFATLGAYALARTPASEDRDL